MKANIHVTNRTTVRELTIHANRSQELIVSHDVYSMYFKRLSLTSSAQTLIIQPTRIEIMNFQHAAERLLNRY